MTGSEIAKLVRAHNGKVSVRALFGDDSPYIYAQKKDLISHFARIGDHETKCEFVNNDGDAFIDTVY